jgi:imidazolonepropionase-like amidohydrolase
MKKCTPLDVNGEGGNYSGGTARGIGFVDAHVHIREILALDDITGAGISAVRDAGMRENAARNIGTINGHGGPPCVVSARWALYKKSGYGSRFGVPVETREEIKTEIIRLKRNGAGIIKAMASGMVSLKEPGRVTAGGFSGDELRFIVQEAAECGLGVMAHANGEQAIIDAARAGVRSIEHGFFMSERTLDVVAKSDAFWVPTVGALRRAAVSGKVSKEAEGFVDGLIRSHIRMIRHAHAVGVPLAVGTDFVLPGVGYREAYLAELRHFEQAGLSRGAVMTVACEGGARLLGI